MRRPNLAVLSRGYYKVYYYMTFGRARVILSEIQLVAGKRKLNPNENTIQSMSVY